MNRNPGGTAIPLRVGSGQRTIMAAFKDYQIDIHLRGLSGEKPKIPVDFSSLETRAQAEMAPDIYAFVACGAGDEHTQDLNVSAFKKWALMPRRLVDCATRDLSVEIFDMRFASSLFLAPSASGPLVVTLDTWTLG
jgi:lactate 2-monooxygenase